MLSKLLFHGSVTSGLFVLFLWFAGCVLAFVFGFIGVLFVLSWSVYGLVCMMVFCLCVI